MRFAVIGSNSFSGSHFVDHLISKDHDVVGISRSDEPDAVFLPYKANPKSSDFKFIAANLNKDIELIGSVLREFQTEVIVNFAAQGMVGESWNTPEEWSRTNLVSQSCFCSEVAKISTLKKYVQVTTPEVYGSTERKITENWNFAPSTPYAVSRAACDWHLRGLFENFGFPVVFTRAANVFGPGQQLYRIVPRTMLFGRTGRVVELHGGGSSIRSFVHIKDVANATHRVAIDGVPGETYHISTCTELSIRELVERISQMLGVRFGDLIKMAPDRDGKDQKYLLDSSFIRTSLGWQDEVSLTKGLEETLGWVDENLAKLKELPTDYCHKQ